MQINIGCRFLATVLFVTSLICGTASGGVIYVSANGNDVADGSSWLSSKATLQAAITTASSGDEIWVAAGTYKPTSGTNRTISFCMKDGVAIYGGFAGTEAGRDERDWQANETILSGDIGVVDNINDNSHYIFYHPQGTNLTSSSILDGFIIQSAATSDMYNYQSNPTIRNCTFRNNYTDDNRCIYNVASDVTLKNCIFTHNSNSGTEGGAIYNSNGSSLYAESCKFLGNDIGNCIINTGSSSAAFYNCVFLFNVSNTKCLCGDIGAALHNEVQSNAEVYNCTMLYNNGRGPGGAIINDANCTLTVTNSIVMGFPDGTNDGYGDGYQIINMAGGTAAVYNSDVVGGWEGDGSGNIDSDPNFADCPEVYNGNAFFRDGSGFANYFGDLHLCAGSPCLDTGDNSYVPSGLATDANGDARITDGNKDENAVVDMGAYETAAPLERADKPTISPDGLTFAESVDVNLSCSMSDAQIRFTTDGNVPDENSELYTGPITISNSCSLMARTFKAGYYPSKTKLAAFNKLADLTSEQVAGQEAYYFKVYNASTHAAISSIGWGQSVYVQYIIKNNGGTNGAFNVAFYMSNDPIIGDQDDYKLAETGVLQVAAGAYRASVSPSLVLPSTLPSGYTGLSSIYIGMKIDSWNGVTESNETNNYNVGLGFDKAKLTISLVTVSGRIVTSSGTAMAGATITASGGAGTTTTNSNGYFAMKVSSGWTGRITPTNSKYTFSPAYRSYTGLVANKSSQNFTAYVMPIVSGCVKTSGGTPLSGVTITAVNVGTTTTNSTGRYAIRVPYNWTGTITAQKTNFSFVPGRFSYTAIRANKSSQNFTAYVMPTLSGRILFTNGTPVSGIAVKAGSRTAYTNSQGLYSIRVPYNWSGVMSVPSSQGLDFVPATRSYTAVKANKSGQNFTAYARPTLWGYVKTSGGTAISGVTIIASNGGGTDLTNSGGAFMIQVPYNWTGRLTASKSGYTFNPIYRSYSGLKANKSGQNFTGSSK